MSKIGDKSTCTMCGKEIYFNGKWWEHAEGSPRHPATPTDKAKEKGKKA